MTRLYFAYGSNLDREQLQKRCPGSRARFRARLLDHRLDFTHYSTRWTGGAADVVPHSGAEVWGAVYELRDEDFDRLDRFERGYDRVLLTVEDEHGRARRVVSYAVREKLSFRPTQAYLQKMLHWGERWRLPPDYLDQLRRLQVVGD